MSLVHSNIIGDAGEDLLILHGFLGMGDNWKTHAKNWAALGFRVHLIDQRNHGRAFWNPAFSYTLMAQDIVDYCREKDIKTTMVLGHSMGGKTAMNIACSFPHLIRAFVVADIAPKTYSPHHQQILNGLSNLNFHKITNRKDADVQLSKYVPDAGTRMFLLKNLYWVEPGKLGLRLNIEVLKNASHEIGQGLNSKMKSDHPCLFVKGAKSDYILDSDVQIINYHFPNAEHRTIPNAGHWLHAENPKLFFSTVTEWLQAHLRAL